MKLNVLLVEDDPLHAKYLKEIVQEALPEAESVIVAINGLEGERIARDLNILAIVMDLRMKERNGIEAARTIWSERSTTRILFWSNHSDEAYIRGVSQIVPKEASYGYVLKTASADRINLALRSVLLEGQIVVDREIHDMQFSTHQSCTALSDGEYAILLDLALGLPDRIIALRHNLSLRTVQNRLLLLYEKLDVSLIGEGQYEIGLNKRVRAVYKAFSQKLINNESVEIAEKDFRRWFIVWSEQQEKTK